MLAQKVDNERFQHLKQIVESSTPQDMMSWPHLTDTDYALWGKFTVLFCYLDFNLRRMVQDLDDAGKLPTPWRGKVTKLSMHEVEQALRTTLTWDEKGLKDFDRIPTLRGLRNVIAHCAVRRFPNDDAYFFNTVNERDYKQVLGIEPKNGSMLTAFVDAHLVNNALGELDGIQDWIAYKASDLAIELEQGGLIKR
jgi:hypothetical protein